MEKKEKKLAFSSQELMDFVAEVNNLLMEVQVSGDNVLKTAALMNKCHKLHSELLEAFPGEEVDEVQSGSDSES